MASTYRYHDMGTPTLRTKFTYSVWVKRSELGSYQTVASMWKDNSNHVVIRFNSDDTLVFYDYSSSTEISELKTNAKYRDVSGWYNIVATFDSTESTDTNRYKLYVNGTQPSLATANYGAQNNTPTANVSGTDNYLGARGDGQNYGGLMSHCHFVDGAAYPASTFGSTDSTTGIWKINTSPTITEYGTNGWFMFKDDASLTDRSGKSNNFTNQSGTLTNTEDCPSNVFATLNALSYQNGTKVAAPTNGNTTLTSNSGNAWGTLLSTIGASSGKYYCEAKLSALGSYARPGICDMSVDQQNSNSGWYLGETSSSAQYSYNSGSGEIYYNNSQSSYGNTFTTGDIIGIAMDLDNSKLYFSKNGTWQNSGVPTSGSTGTGAVSITAGKNYGFGFSGYDATVWNVNFGNGLFGTTAISSEGTNASGIGKFEYDVPTGYTALSTKGLNL